MRYTRNPFRIFVNQRIQSKFALYVGGLIACSLLLVWGSIEIIIWILIRRYADDPAVIEMLKDIHFHIIYFFFWEGLIAVGAGVVLTLFLSRRIVGPIYRIQEELQYFLKNKKRDSPELRVRTHDEFKELGHLFNQLIDEMDKKG